MAEFFMPLSASAWADAKVAPAQTQPGLDQALLLSIPPGSEVYAVETGETLLISPPEGPPYLRLSSGAGRNWFYQLLSMGADVIDGRTVRGGTKLGVIDPGGSLAMQLHTVTPDGQARYRDPIAFLLDAKAKFVGGTAAVKQEVEETEIPEIAVSLPPTAWTTGQAIGVAAAAVAGVGLVGLIAWGLTRGR